MYIEREREREHHLYLPNVCGNCVPTNIFQFKKTLHKLHFLCLTAFYSYNSNISNNNNEAKYQIYNFLCRCFIFFNFFFFNFIFSCLLLLLQTLIRCNATGVISKKKKKKRKDVTKNHIVIIK